MHNDNDDFGDSEFNDLDDDDWDWTHEVPNNTFMQEENDGNQISLNQDIKLDDLEAILACIDLMLFWFGYELVMP